MLLDDIIGLHKAFMHTNNIQPNRFLISSDKYRKFVDESTKIVGRENIKDIDKFLEMNVIVVANKTNYMEVSYA